MSHSFTLSEAVHADLPAIEHLLDLCFGPQRRTKTSYRLREGSQAVDGLSQVVRDEVVGIAGAISYWPLAIGARGRFCWVHWPYIRFGKMLVLVDY
jgi:predicted N-acetyltransferase YhbS